MKYLNEEDNGKLKELGIKISQARKLMQEITEFFVKKDDNVENYYSAQELLEIIRLYIDGESLDYIGEQIWQDDGESVRDILKTMDIDCSNIVCTQEGDTDYLGEQEFIDSEKTTK